MNHRTPRLSRHSDPPDLVGTQTLRARHSDRKGPGREYSKVRVGSTKATARLRSSAWQWQQAKAAMRHELRSSPVPILRESLPQCSAPLKCGSERRCSLRSQIHPFDVQQLHSHLVFNCIPRLEKLAPNLMKKQQPTIKSRTRPVVILRLQAAGWHCPGGEEDIPSSVEALKRAMRSQPGLAVVARTL